MRTEIATTTESTKLIEAIKMMMQNKFGCLPVVDSENNLTGIITEEDVSRLAIRLLEKDDERQKLVQIK